MAREMKGFAYSGNPDVGYQTPGEFRKVASNEWVELQEGRQIWRFQQFHTDEAWVVLFDTGRKMLIALPMEGG